MDTHLNQLAKRAVDGERLALRELLLAIQGPIYRLALRMLFRPADAEDATQEIMIKVFTRLATFEGRADLLTWVYTIASRHLLRMRKRKAEDRARSIADIAELIDRGMTLAPVGALPSAEVRVLAKEVQLECTHGMLLALSRGERLAYILADVLGASDRVGAEICEISAATFRKRLERARAAMRPILAERCGLADPANPCRCERQAAAHELAGVPLARRFRELPVETTVQIARANEQLGQLSRARHLFHHEPPVAAPIVIWEKLSAAFPDLLGEIK